MRRYDYSEPSALNQWERDITDSEGLPLVIPKRYTADIDFKDIDKYFEWQITYKFSSARRHNFFGTANGKVQYGASNMTFRRLYLILCNRFNGGVSFIDDYLENVLPYSSTGKKLSRYLLEVRREAERKWKEAYDKAPKRKDGKVYLRSRPRLYLLQAVMNTMIKEQGAVIAKRIREDLIWALHDGRVPLFTHLVSTSTQQARKKAGLNPTPRFYASAQFINSITVFCRLERRGKWKMNTLV